MNIRRIITQNAPLVLLLGLLFFGLAVIIVGIVIPPKMGSCVIAVGGAVAGASLGAFFARLINKDLDQDIRSILSNTLASKFLSDDAALSVYRRKWHLYYVTQMDDNHFWRHFILDFSKQEAVGKLIAPHSVTGKNNEVREYTTEGYIRSGRLILFVDPVHGNEPCGIHIFSFFGADFLAKHYGILIHQTWDSNHSISPTIMSENSLVPDCEGNLEETEAQKLDLLWKNSCGQTILPRIISSGK